MYVYRCINMVKYTYETSWNQELKMDHQNDSNLKSEDSARTSVIECMNIYIPAPTIPLITDHWEAKERSLRIFIQWEWSCEGIKVRDRRFLVWWYRATNWIELNAGDRIEFWSVGFIERGKMRALSYLDSLTQIVFWNRESDKGEEVRWNGGHWHSGYCYQVKVTEFEHGEGQFRREL